MSIIVLFINLDDFDKKIQNIDLNVCFPNYTGGCNYDAAIRFIREKFISSSNNRSVSSYPFSTSPF